MIQHTSMKAAEHREVRNGRAVRAVNRGKPSGNYRNLMSIVLHHLNTVKSFVAFVYHFLMFATVFHCDFS